MKTEYSTKWLTNTRILSVRTLSVVSPQLSVLLLLLALLAGCGYQFRVEGAGPTIGGSTTAPPAVPPPRLVVRTLENKSFEPNLETRYTNYLRHEFSSGSGAQIVAESEAADLVLTGQILSVSVPTLSFSQTTTLERNSQSHTTSQSIPQPFSETIIETLDGIGEVCL